MWAMSIMYHIILMEKTTTGILRLLLRFPTTTNQSICCPSSHTDLVPPYYPWIEIDWDDAAFLFCETLDMGLDLREIWCAERERGFFSKKSSSEHHQSITKFVGDIPRDEKLQEIRGWSTRIFLNHEFISHWVLFSVRFFLVFSVRGKEGSFLLSIFLFLTRGGG